MTRGLQLYRVSSIWLILLASTCFSFSIRDQQLHRTTLHGALSRSIPELALELGGLGRAKLAWDCYKHGVDPAVYFASDIVMPEIQKLIPGSRRQQRLGKSAIETLNAVNHHGTMEDVAKVSLVSTSSDSTTKLLLELSDGLQVETVIIPTDTRSTLCISSQVGCRQACTFCATGTMGIRRNLSADEILIQVFHAIRICRERSLPKLSNIVFMGMGEPTDNMNEVNLAVRQLTTRELFQFSASKVTVSTVAPTPDVFAAIDKHCVLAWSVHAANDALRRRLVPTTRYSMKELSDGLIAALNQRSLRTTMLEYVLIANVNDSHEHAEELANLAHSISENVEHCKLLVNVIPYNAISSTNSAFQTPDYITIRAFQKQLWSRGVYTHVRTTRGDDESAACGQLVTQQRRRLVSP